MLELTVLSGGMFALGLTIGAAIERWHNARGTETSEQ